MELLGRIFSLFYFDGFENGVILLFLNTLFRPQRKRVVFLQKQTSDYIAVQAAMRDQSAKRRKEEHYITWSRPRKGWVKLNTDGSVCDGGLAAAAGVIRDSDGTSLPGLVAAKVGANVTLTDDLDRPEVLDNIGRVCELNKLKCEVLGLTWGVWDEHIFGLHPQIILGADVLYDTCAFEDLFSTVAFLLESCPGSVFITTYHNRSGHHLIEFLMVKWGLKAVKLVDGFSFLPSYKASGLSGNIQLAEIVLNSHQEKSLSRSGC